MAATEGERDKYLRKLKQSNKARVKAEEDMRGENSCRSLLRLPRIIARRPWVNTMWVHAVDSRSSPCVALGGGANFTPCSRSGANRRAIEVEEVLAEKVRARRMIIIECLGLITSRF